MKYCDWLGSVTAAALLAMCVSMGGFASAAPLPGDYTTLPIDPNVVTDSLAYSAAAPVQNPNERGVTEVYTHRDGTRQISTPIMVLPTPSRRPHH